VAGGFWLVHADRRHFAAPREAARLAFVSAIDFRGFRPGAGGMADIAMWQVLVRADRIR